MREQKATQSSTNRKQRAAYDSPWKASVERLFPHFMEFFFPDIHALIDWSKRFKFLSQELAQISAGIEGELNKQASARLRTRPARAVARRLAR